MARKSRKSSNQLLVAECGQALDQWKYEIAAELGLAISYPESPFNNQNNVEFATELGAITSNQSQQSEPYWGHVSSRETGAVGGEITRRLIALAQLTKSSD